MARLEIDNKRLYVEGFDISEVQGLGKPGTFTFSGYVLGDCEVEDHDGAVVVTKADNHIEASAELIEQWRAGTPRVQVDGDVFTFGTEGKGVGVVSYRLGEPSTDPWGNPWFLLHRER